jgi:1,2-phenylacetyl-CoA epoxidase PaaB subunit
MARESKKELRWEVLRLKGSPAAYVGTVLAPDEKTALDRAIEKHGIRPADRKRLLVRRLSS